MCVAVFTQKLCFYICHVNMSIEITVKTLDLHMKQKTWISIEEKLIKYNKLAQIIFWGGAFQGHLKLLYYWNTVKRSEEMTIYFFKNWLGNFKC